MNKPILSGLIIVALAMVACEKEDESNDTIIGKWEWIMTSYGDYNIPSTPETIDSTYFIEFTSDGYCNIFGNSNNQLNKLSYTLGNTDPIKTVEFENGSAGLIYGYNITNDTLRLWIMNQLNSATNLYKRIL